MRSASSVPGILRFSTRYRDWLKLRLLRVITNKRRSWLLDSTGELIEISQLQSLPQGRAALMRLLEHWQHSWTQRH